MKSRFGYVSNSSSSSFVLDDRCPFTAADIGEFVMSSIIGYDDKIKDLVESRDTYEPGVLDENDWTHCIFCVFDLKDKYQLMEAKLTLADYLKGWKDGVAIRCDDGSMMTLGRWMSQAMESGLDAGREGCSFNGLDDFEMVQMCKDIRIWLEKKGKTDMSVEDVLGYAASFLKEMKKRHRHCDNYRAMLAKNAAVVVHFDENEIWSISGITKTGDEYETGDYTYQRFCELFVRWMQERGRLSNEYTWSDMVDSTIARNMHEG